MHENKVRELILQHNTGKKKARKKREVYDRCNNKRKKLSVQQQQHYKQRETSQMKDELPANQESKGSHPQALDISRSVMRTDKTLQREENRNERL
jgi:hypothetical protein